ncbi:MAG: hypothetical protein FWF98_04330 [Dehalococcoidia bacterium]|nr:hypothetical protein [Dehalococcoidia bacterium]
MAQAFALALSLVACGGGGGGGSGSLSFECIEFKTSGVSLPAYNWLQE